VGLPLMTHKFDSIWVIVDRLSKSANFIPINTKYRRGACFCCFDL
jgi:hypothetical protein